MWYLIESISDLCTLTYFVVHGVPEKKIPFLIHCFSKTIEPVKRFDILVHTCMCKFTFYCIITEGILFSF